VHKRYNRQVEKHIVNQYEVLGKEAMDLPGDIADPNTLRGAYVKHFTDLYDDVYSKEGHKIIMESKLERAGTLLKGVTVGNTWKPDTRKKLMIAALVGSYLAMRTDADLEKYGTCGGGKMCLHYPMLFGKDNNEPYEQDEPLTLKYEGLVMGALPALGKDEVDRFHIMSPCKTDLVVAAYEQDDWRCKCEEFYKHDSTEIVYKRQKVRCVSDIFFITETAVPINADGSCPETHKRTGTDKIKIKSDNIKTHEGRDTFSCDISGVPYDDINEALDECIYKFMHKDGCVDDTDTDYDDCLIDLYRDCYFDPNEAIPRYPGTDAEGKYFCYNDQSGVHNCNSEGCIGMHNSHSTVPFSKHKDTFAIPVNAKENVNTGVLEPVTVCTNSWSSSFTVANPSRYKPCIVVRYEVDSMRAYSKAGFGANYCAENKAQLADVLEGTCFWGGMAGAVAVSALSGGVTGTVIIPVAIGSASIGCEKIADMQTKWPQSQY